MAIKKVQIIPPNYTDIIHPETDSSVVLMGSGKTLQSVSNRSQRFVVGTSTAGWTLDDCDYLCDGTKDQEEIIQALNDLPATGGEVVILDGTYNITASINIPKDNVSIRGSGNATTLKRMYNSTNTDSGATAKGLITLNEKSGCKIQGLQIEGNKTNYTNDNNSGIYLNSSNSNTITGNTYNDNRNTGIYLNSSNNNTIISNTCNDNGYYGIYLNSSNSNTITGNTYNDNEYHGIYLYSSSNDNIITGNTCNNNSRGIYLYSSSNNTVTGNTCNNNTYGFYLYLSSRNIVTSNTCIRGTGLSTDYTTSQYTIRLYGTGNSYNLIAMNNCMGKAPVVEGGTGNTVINNKWNATSDFEDLRADVGDKTTLTTTDKTNLVNAVNETKAQINDLDADVVAHKADEATQTTLGHIKGVVGDQVFLGNNIILDGSTGATIAIGNGSAIGPYSSGSAIAIGTSARAGGFRSIAIGRGATSKSSGTNYRPAMALGADAIATNDWAIVIGTEDNKTTIPGTFTVNGTKNFEIPHPKPEKKATHMIRHGAVESPTAGDTLYRYKIQATKDNDMQVIDLPDYFIYLNKDVQIFVTPQGHFGNGYGVLNKETEQLEIYCQYEGEYNVLVIGTRNDDHQSVKDWDIKGVEREIGESWTGETYAFSVEEIIEVEEIKEEVA
jgi:parallel beta-helix repeat protein